MKLTQFFKLTRPRTLIASLGPVLIGFSFASYHYVPEKDFSSALLRVLLVFLVVSLSQIAINCYNEYFDYKSGLDKDQVVGNSGSITKDGISPSMIKKIADAHLGLAVLLGCFLAWNTSLSLLPFGFLCVLIGYLYSGGPYPISRTPYGEVASGFAMGFAIVVIIAFVWIGEYKLALLIPALPSFLLVAAIMLTNNLRDMTNDKKHGRRTLPIQVGREKALTLLKNGFYLVFAWTLLWTLFGYSPWPALLSLMAMVPARRVITIFQTYSDVRSLDKALIFCVLTNLIYSFGLSLGTLASMWIK